MINVDKVRGLLSPTNQKLWDEVVQEEILAYAREKNLTIEQVNLLRARKMAELRYGDLNGKNEYLAKSSDELAIRAIKKNKLEMQKMNREYKSLEKSVIEFEKEFDQRLSKVIEKQNSKNKSKKTGK